MCSCAAHVLLAHLLGLALGVMVIADLLRRRPSSHLFWIAVGAASLAMAAFTFHVSEPLLRFDDFTTAYWVAGKAALQGREAIVALYGDGVTGFVNLPILAYLFIPFAVLPTFPGALLFTAIGIVAVFAAWALLARAAILDNGAKALLLFLFASFGPLIYSIREANTSHMVLVLCVWALLLLRERKDLIAGAALGVAALIKPPLLLFGIYFTLRGRWSAVLGGAAVVGGVSLLSVAVFGWDAHLRWYDTSIAPFARDPMPALNVQSIAGAIARFEIGPGSARDWTPHQLTPVSQAIVRGSTVLIILLALGAALAPRPKTAHVVSRDTTYEGEYLIVLMLACVISTLSWTHYYAWMLMPIAFFIGRTPHFSSSLPVRALGWGAIVLAAAPSVTLEFQGALLHELNARLGYSRLLAGGLCMLGLLIWSRWQMMSHAQDGVAEARAP